MGTWGNVLISHLLLVIPMSYPCHYTNLCPHLSQKHAHIHTHTQIHKKIYNSYRHWHLLYNEDYNFWFRCQNKDHTHTHTNTLHRHIGLYKLYFLSPYTNPTPKPTPHRKLSAFLDFQFHSVWFISLFPHGDLKNVPTISWYYYCGDIWSHNVINTRYTHTHTHTHTHLLGILYHLYSIKIIMLSAQIALWEAHWHKALLYLQASRVQIPAWGPFPILTLSLTHFASCLLYTVLSIKKAKHQK